jgi:hypothetical protein
MDENRATNSAYQLLQIQFYLKAPFAPGFVGPVAVDHVKLNLSKGGVTSKWVGTACTVEITKNEADAGAGDGGTGGIPFRAWGKGSCAEALPVEKDASAPAQVGPYEFMFQSGR